MDEAPSGIRVALVRFRNFEESIRFQLLLKDHGYDQPMWLGNLGEPVPSPPLPDAGPQKTWELDPHEKDSTMERCATLPFLKLPVVPAFGGSTQTPPPECRSLSPLSPLTTPPALHIDEAPAEEEKRRPTTKRSWVNPAPLRPRGKKPKEYDDPNVYYFCQLCKNRILGTRVSNLHNHVRRHSTVKQFQCVYCEYAHNEIAKVRFHMTNNHKDNDSQPLNNVNPGMRAIWKTLFQECFPTRVRRKRAAKKDLMAPPPIIQFAPARVI